ncbi:MAG: methyl-accepting chemotaxis protein, partial [Spirochaetota bacterium]|nr:methyl-accepting chemotaxis protein [Spirochaetota bacterium]
MNLLSRISLLTKLSISHGAIFLFLIVLAYISHKHITEQNQLALTIHMTEGQARIITQILIHSQYQPESDAGGQKLLAHINDFEARQKRIIFGGDTHVKSEIAGIQSHSLKKQPPLKTAFQKITASWMPFKTLINKNINQEYSRKAYQAIFQAGTQLLSSIDKALKELKALSVRRANNFSVQVIVLLISALLTGLLVVILIKRLMIGPIHHITSTLRRVASENDLRAMVQIKSNTEFGGISNSLNLFITKISKNIKAVKAELAIANSLRDGMLSGSVGTTLAIEELKYQIESMEAQMRLLDEDIIVFEQNVIDMKRFVEQVVDMIGNLASSVEESSAATEEMASSIHHIAQIAQARLEKATELEKTSSGGEKIMSDTMVIIKKITDSVTVMVDMIN